LAVSAFASGGSFAVRGASLAFRPAWRVVSGATHVPSAAPWPDGEADQEAIMPLARGPDGKLGRNRGGGGNPVNV